MYTLNDVVLYENKTNDWFSQFELRTLILEKHLIVKAYQSFWNWIKLMAFVWKLSQAFKVIVSLEKLTQFSILFPESDVIKVNILVLINLSSQNLFLLPNRLCFYQLNT